MSAAFLLRLRLCVLLRPVLNRQLWMAVFPAGPQPPDLNHEFRLAFPAGPQTPALVARMLVTSGQCDSVRQP